MRSNRPMKPSCYNLKKLNQKTLNCTTCGKNIEGDPKHPMAVFLIHKKDCKSSKALFMSGVGLLTHREQLECIPGKRPKGDMKWLELIDELKPIASDYLPQDDLGSSC